MGNIDGRMLITEAQQRNRYIAVKLYKSGKTYTAVANALGISVEAVRKYWKLYKEGGYQNLKIKKRGIKPGTNCNLDQEQIKYLRYLLITNTPDQLKLGFVLWTREAIRSLITALWNISLSLTTVGRYMKQLGFMQKKTVKHAYKHSPEAVKKWLKLNYPKIDKIAKKENAEIYCLDKTEISSYRSYLRRCPLKKKPLVIKVNARYLSLNIISSVSKLGKIRFMTYAGSLNINILINFVDRLCRAVHKNIFVILDNLVVYHSKKFIEWINNHKNKIIVFYLPSYSPKLKLDERLYIS